MNKTINSVPIEDILFWDMEVVRESNELEIGSKAYELFRTKTRNRETDEYLSDDDLQTLYKRQGALNPTHNKIVCLSMGFVKDGRINVKSLKGEQSEIITEFSKVLSKGYMPCGWNIIKFDFPILRLKAFQEGIIDYAPDNFNDAGKKEWNMSEIKYKLNIIDLMLIYQGSHYSPSSLAEACYLLDVPTPKDDIDGSQVSDVYYSEGVDRIATYCQKDVVACIHILQRMRGQELITDINYKNVETKEDLSVLVKLSKENYLSDKLKKEFTEVFKAKKLTKKDRPYVEDLMIASYVKSAFSTEDSTAMDSDDIVTHKTEEIQTFLDEYFKK